MKRDILIVGSGAIGRGFLPLVIDIKKYNLIFTDNDKKLKKKFIGRKFFNIYKIKNNKYYKKKIFFKSFYYNEELTNQNLENIVACFIAVGPHKLKGIKKILKMRKIKKIPIIVCENDFKAINFVKKISKNKKVFFAIPDVITSNTAPNYLLKKDNLSTVSENGKLIIETRPAIHGNFHFVKKTILIKKYWQAKFFLHNTPHCIVSYLGNIVNAKYIHQAMRNPKINFYTLGAMSEVLQLLMLSKKNKKFFKNYAQKEILRFENNLLFDKISRVAREPLRKLKLDGRLIGAARLCIKQGIYPKFIIKGIIAAIFFYQHQKKKINLKNFAKKFRIGDFNTKFLGLKSKEKLNFFLKKDFRLNCEKLLLLNKKK
jgi:hypothetical protein